MISRTTIKLNGVTIYFLGVTLLILKHIIDPQPYADFFDFFGLLLINPLMIYVYDYLLNPKVLEKIQYRILIILCCLFEVLQWDQFRQLQGATSFIETFVGKVIVVSLIIQFFIAMFSVKYHFKKWSAIMLLMIMPLMTYSILAFMNLLVGFGAP